MAATQTELEEFAAGKLDDVSEDVQMFLTDKDVVMAALSSSHDSHLAKIDGLEDKICTKERRDAQAIYQKYRTASTQRDRNRLTEIGKLTAQNSEYIQRLVLDEQEGAYR